MIGWKVRMHCIPLSIDAKMKTLELPMRRPMAVNNEMNYKLVNEISICLKGPKDLTREWNGLFQYISDDAENHQ